MPTYQYTCTECGHDLEAVQKFTDDPLVECPQCSGKLRKVFSAVGVVFKGSGFYRTDSRQKSSSSTAAASSDKAGSDKAGSDKAASDKAKASSEHASPVGGSSSSSSTAKKSESAA